MDIVCLWLTRLSATKRNWIKRFSCFFLAWINLNFKFKRDFLRAILIVPWLRENLIRTVFLVLFYQFGVEKVQRIKATLQEENLNCSHIFIVTITIEAIKLVNFLPAWPSESSLSLSHSVSVIEKKSETKIKSIPLLWTARIVREEKLRTFPLPLPLGKRRKNTV